MAVEQRKMPDVQVFYSLKWFRRYGEDTKVGNANHRLSWKPHARPMVVEQRKVTDVQVSCSLQLKLNEENTSAFYITLTE